jgi:hypothetical protein
MYFLDFNNILHSPIRFYHTFFFYILYSCIEFYHIFLEFDDILYK